MYCISEYSILFSHILPLTHVIIHRHLKDSQNKPVLKLPLLHPFNPSGLLLQKTGLLNYMHTIILILLSLRPKEVMVATSIPTTVHRLLHSNCFFRSSFLAELGFQSRGKHIDVPQLRGLAACSGLS